MTPEDLESLVLGYDDSSRLEAALAPLTEPERAKLSTAAQKLFKQLYRNKADQAASDRLKTFIGRRKGKVWELWNAPETCLATLAVFGLCPISVVKKRDIRIWHSGYEAFDRIIRDRRPDWLDEWIAHDLGDDVSTQLDFRILRGWIRDGICRKPEVEGYYRMFAWFLMRTGFYTRGEVVPPISVQLLEDPDMLVDVEALFRVENIAFNTNAWLTKGAAPDHETWTDALLKLSAGGHLDREYLLGLALEGLTRDLKQNQLAGFHGFYKRMAPSDEEQVRHQQRYIDLLCLPVGHVVKFAIDMLAGIEKKGGLDTEPVLREIQAVFSSGAKGNATAALKLIARIITRSKGSERAALAAVCEALRHAHPDVQSLALDILEPHVGRLAERQLDALLGMEVFVAASNRPRLAKLLADAGPGAGAREALEAANDAAAVEAEPAAQPDIPAYRPISDDLNDHSVLGGAEAIEPIASVDALIDAVLHAIEIVDSPDDVERIIDGISRLAHDRPADFDARVAPLLHRLEKGGGAPNGIVIGSVVLGQVLHELIGTWATGKLQRTNALLAHFDTPEDTFRPVIAHLHAIAERVAGRQGQQLLSAPTHKGGWIDPLVWVERLRALQERPGIAESMDLRLSLLRLAPDNRGAALDRTASLAEPLRRIANFALGGDERPGRADRANYAAWICAARCRAPHADWSAEFAPLDLDDQWPDSLKPARYVWRSSHEKGQYGNQTWKTPEFKISVTRDGDSALPERRGRVLKRLAQAVSGRTATDWSALPTAALNRMTESRQYWSGDLHAAWVTQWLAYIWPQSPAAAHMKGVVKLMLRTDDDSSGWSPGFGYFHALFQQGRPWGEPGHLLLCVGLVGKDADAKGLAVDALIEGIDVRLFDPDVFAATIARLAEGEWIKLNRLGDALMPVIQHSALHAAVVSEALQTWLPNLDLRQKNAFRLLEVIVEAQAIAARPLSPDAREALGRIDGNGKSAKIARQLLQA